MQLNIKISRKNFLKYLLAGFAALSGAAWFERFAFSQGTSNGRPKRQINADYDLAVVKGEDPADLARKSVNALGGMGRFVKKGDIVVVKPNIGWDRAPEYAANTNPMVVAAIVQMCYEAGAKRVNVFDITCNSAQRCYDSSGIKAAAEAKGAKVYFADDWNFIKARFDYQSPMQDWPVFRDAVECDVFINVPVLKHHGLTRLTLSMKNLMGVCGGNRGQMHTDIGRKLVDVTDFIKPDLTVMDAYRVLTAHGPIGGDLKDVEFRKTVIAGIDPTLVDTYACTLMNVEPGEVSYLEEAARRGFGKSDISSARIFSLNA